MKNLWSLYINGISNQKFSVFCRVFFCGVFKAAICVFIGAKYFFSEKMKNYFIILDFELKIFGHLVKFFSTVLSKVKTAFFLSLGTLFIVLKFLYSSCHVWTLIGKKSAFRRGCLNCFLCFHRILSKKKYFAEIVFLTHTKIEKKTNGFVPKKLR